MGVQKTLHYYPEPLFMNNTTKHNTMKYFSTRSSVFVLLVSLVMLACSNNNDANSGTNTTTPVTPAVPLQNTTAAAGLDHYTCPNGHAGAAAAGNCATCGVALEHNQAYHNNQPAETPNISTTPTTPNTTTAASPAQNAAGEYHYTCPNGHAGAAGAGSCATCGAALAHNTAYHNTPATVTPTTPNVTPAASGSGPIFAPMLQDNAGTPAARVPQTTTTAATPAKNAAGQYHYTCPNGHAGAGAAGSCSTCGSALTHNPAYHN